MVWICHEERPVICRKKGDGKGVIGKEGKRKAEEKISEFSEEGYREVGTMEKDIENKTLWKNITP